MDNAEELIRIIEDDWGTVIDRLKELLVSSSARSQPDSEILAPYRSSLGSWAAHRAGKVAQQKESHQEAVLRFRKSVVELVLWHLYTTTDDPEIKREFEGALWTCLAEVIDGKAVSFVRSRRKGTIVEDEIEELRHGCYTRFRYWMDKFEPSRGPLGGFVHSNATRQMSTLHSKAKRILEHERQVDHLDSRVDESSSKKRSQHDQRGRIDDVLVRLKSENTQEAERVEAFIMYNFNQMTMEEVGKSMGRSVGWVHKSNLRIQDMLIQEIRNEAAVDS